MRAAVRNIFDLSAVVSPLARARVHTCSRALSAPWSALLDRILVWCPAERLYFQKETLHPYTDNVTQTHMCHSLCAALPARYNLST